VEHEQALSDALKRVKEVEEQCEKIRGEKRGLEEEKEGAGKSYSWNDVDDPREGLEDVWLMLDQYKRLISFGRNYQRCSRATILPLPSFQSCKRE
jgi:hypothetical protein